MAVADRAGLDTRPDLYRGWRRLAPYDPDLARMAGPGVRALALALPDEATDAVVMTLAARGIGSADAVAYLEAQLARLPGWAAAFAREVDTGRRHALVEFAATRLAVEHLLVESAAPPASSGHAARVADHDDAARTLEMAEAAYRDDLLARIAAADDGADDAAERPEAQLVFCIDVRSEGIRRPLEAVGPYETLGFAGFFGLPIAIRDDEHHEAVAHCPVILDPKATVIDPGRRHDDAVHDRFATAKGASSSGYVLADASGWLLGVKTLGTSLAPRWWDRLSRFVTRPPARDGADLVLDPSPDLPSDIGLTPDDQAQIALGALTAMGLTRDFAPLVVFCGHHSDHRNNPFRSALHCGACGGNPGGTNARVLAAICNRPAVRMALAAHGVVIGDDTWFLAATHETTDDVVTVLDVDEMPDHLAPYLDRLTTALGRVGDTSRRERLDRQPGSPVRRDDPRRSVDPAQVVPDWGLARNAAIVVGPAPDDRTHGSRPAGVPAFVSSRRRSRGGGARGDHDRSGGRRTLDQRPVLLLDRRSAALRRRLEAVPQRHRSPRRGRGDVVRSAHRAAARVRGVRGIGLPRAAATAGRDRCAARARRPRHRPQPGAASSRRQRVGPLRRSTRRRRATAVRGAHPRGIMDAMATREPGRAQHTERPPEDR